MKTPLLVLSFLSVASLASERPDAWVCDVKRAVGRTELEISLTDPTVTAVRYYPQDDGSIKVVREELITRTTVAARKYSIASCEYKGGFSTGEYADVFDSSYRCAADNATIRFSMDFKNGTAFYREHLTLSDGSDVSRSFPASHCRAQ